MSAQGLPTSTSAQGSSAPSNDLDRAVTCKALQRGPIQVRDEIAKPVYPHDLSD
jgi:hypothetical protein